MGIFNDLSGMIETARAKAAPHDALSSSRKLIPPENVVWRSPSKSLAAIDPLPRHRRYGDEIGNFPDIVDLNEGAMNLARRHPKCIGKMPTGQIKLKSAIVTTA
jgi:hypothetical protein